MAITKSNARLLAVNLKAGNKKIAVQIALQSSIEQDNGQVYLPNAYGLVKSHVTPREWAGLLSVLEREGKYVSYGDDHFGRYIMSKAAE